MTVSTYDPMWTRGKGVVTLQGMFYPQGTGTPLFGSTAVKASASATKDASSSSGGWSVARTGVGAFLLTLKDPNIREILDVQFQIGMASATDLKPQIGAITLSAGVATIAVSLLAVATPTEVAANADNRVSFSVKVRRSSVKG